MIKGFSSLVEVFIPTLSFPIVEQILFLFGGNPHSVNKASHQVLITVDLPAGQAK